MAASAIPLDVGDTTVVGWGLDLLFLLSLSLVPPPRRRIELFLVLAATLSTMVVFAVERANPDIMLFMLALATGSLAEGQPFVRLFGYFVALVSALLKYYPITVLIIVFHERIGVFVLVALILMCSLGVFWAEYHVEIARGLPNIARGPYNSDLFAAKNLPFLLGEAVGNAAEPSSLAPLVGRAAVCGLYAALVVACVAVCRRLLGFGELRSALASLPRFERVFLVIGSAVIVGCFFTGQSIGYRGIFLLLVLPGLLGISREQNRNVRRLGLGTGIVIVLLMWGECIRHALYSALENPRAPQILAGDLKILFWLVREFAWWWSVSVMLTVLTDFLRDSPTLNTMRSLFDRLAVRAR
jgi:hypothetical protein